MSWTLFELAFSVSPQYHPRMHGVPDDLDLSGIEGYGIGQIAIFGAGSLSLVLWAPTKEARVRGDQGLIRIEGGWQLLRSDGAVFGEENAMLSDLRATLLDQSIVGWQRESAVAMRLVLENGAVLRIIENDTRYEFVTIEVTGISGPGIYL